MLSIVRFNKKNAEKKLNKIFCNSIQKAQQTTEYKQNEMEINCIKNVLINNADVPEKLVSWLIDAVEENKALEYEAINKDIMKYIDADIDTHIYNN